jgi:ABC-type transport system substrate-binding protein
MLLKRLFLCVIPVLLISGYVAAYFDVREETWVGNEGEIVFAVREGSDEINPLNPGNRTAETIEGLLFNALLERDAGLKLQPGLARSWEPSQTAHYFFLTDEGAEAAEAMLREQEGQWLSWGISEVLRERDEVRVRFRQHEAEAPGRVYGLFDSETVAPVKLLKVRVFQNGRASYLDFIRGAVEATQVRREWFGSESSYELALVGEEEDFLREFRNYYEANPTLGASFQLDKDVNYLVEPELVFTLNQGVFWHDGVPLTSADVLYSFDWSRRQPWNRELRGAFSSVLGLEAVDDIRVRVVYRELDALYLETWANLPILPGHLFKDKGVEWWESEFGRAPVGTGPFKVESWGDGDEVVLVRYDQYYLGAPQTERLRFTIMPDGVERRLRLLRGEIDSYLLEYPESRLMERDERFSVVLTRPPEESVLFWNNVKAPADQVEVRRAIAGVIDSVRLIEAVAPGRGNEPGGVFHPTSEYAPGSAGGLELDLVAAQEALAEGGWTRAGGGTMHSEEGEPLVIRLGLLDESDFETAAYLRDVLKSIGVEMEIGRVELEELTPGDLFQSDYHGVLIDHYPSLDWAAFQMSPLGQLLARAMQEYPSGDGGLRDEWEALRSARSDAERLTASGAVLKRLGGEQLFTVLYGKPEYRVLPRGEIGISRGVGDGRRVNRDLDPGGEAMGVDSSLAWWIKR